MNNYSTGTLVHETNLLMDRIAEFKLQNALGISYTRFIFLYTVEQLSSTTQHNLALALKISDPAVSKMCAEGERDGMLRIITNPQHKRQRLVDLTVAGRTILRQSLAVLDDCFSDVGIRAQIDETAYREQTIRLLHSLHDEYKKIIGGNRG